VALLDKSGETLWAEGLLQSVTIDPRSLARLRKTDLVDGFGELAAATFYYQAAQFESGGAAYTLVGGANLAVSSAESSQSNLISSYIRDFRYKETGFACVLGWTDSLKLRPAYSLDPITANSSALKLLAKAPFESVEFLPAESASYYFYKKQIRRTPWQLVILFARSEMLFDVYRSVAGQALIFLILTLIIWLIIAKAVGRITSPIEEMAKSMSLIAGGDYEVEFRPVSSKDEIGVVSRAFSSLIKSVKEYSEKLRELSITDALTGLFNQREFRARFEKEWERSTRYGNNLSFLMIDIDLFKRFNDEFGHQKGDEVLKAVAVILKDNIRDADTAFRYGGEEFSVILPQTDLKRAEIAAEKLRVAAERLEPFSSEDSKERRITISVGVSSFPECTNSREELIRLADEALYEAKEMGRNRVRLARATKMPFNYSEAVG
jgi:diguanylate cyclase (GGDEF)-like protein